MTECHNETMREQLPLLELGTLSAAEAHALRAHVAGCASCAAELVIIERSARLFNQATPVINTAAILAKLPAAPGSRPTLTVSRGSRSVLGMPRYALAAAASLVLVASLSLAALRDNFNNTPVGPDISIDTGIPSAPSLPVGMVGGNELGDLDVSELESLLSELEQLEATVEAEPVTMQRPVTEAPEGL